MTPQDFCYWLQGFFEMTETDSLSPVQTEILRDHLKLVFEKKTPDRLLDSLRDIGGPRQPIPPSPQEAEKQRQAVEDFKRHIEELKQRQTSPVQPKPYYQPQDYTDWKLPQTLCCDSGTLTFTSPTEEYTVVDASGWSPPKNPFIC